MLFIWLLEMDIHCVCRNCCRYGAPFISDSCLLVLLIIILLLFVCSSLSERYVFKPLLIIIASHLWLLSPLHISQEALLSHCAPQGSYVFTARGLLLQYCALVMF